MKKNIIQVAKLVADIEAHDYSITDIEFNGDKLSMEVFNKLTPEELAFLRLVKVEVDIDSFVINLTEAMESEEFTGNYPLIGRILTKTIPESLKDVLCEQFGGGENVKVSFGTELSYIDENGRKQGHYTLDEIPEYSFDIEIVGNGNSQYAPDDTPIELLKNMQDELDAFKSRIEEGKSEIEGIFNYSSHHSDLSKGKIGINVKMYSMSYPTTDEVKEELLKRGYTEESVEETVTDELMGRKANWHQETGWSAFEEPDTTDIEFLGADGRMGGYAIFKVGFLGLSGDDEDYSEYTLEDCEREGIDILDAPLVDSPSLEAFSKWVKECYESVNKGETLDDVIEKIIDEGEVETYDEGKERIAKIEYEASRKFDEEYRATKEFKMNGTTYITHWGENRLPKDRVDEHYIVMDEAIFEADELTAEVIFENLNDAQFGVQNIEGGEVWVEQKQDVIKTYEDGEVKNYSVWIDVLENCVITDKETDLSDELYGDYISPTVQEVQDRNKEKREAPKNEDNPNNGKGLK